VEKMIEKISESELEIMQAVWEHGKPMNIAEIRTAVSERSGWESSTIKTLVQRLLAKGILEQTKREVYYYSPAITREEYNRYATKKLIDRLYSGSVKNLVAALVEVGLDDSDMEELAAILKKGEKHD